ncbi:MAG: hypothetical protein ABFR36_04415 [Acidobacteriota bacterium]
MLFGMFLGDYKKVRTKYNKEKNKLNIPEKESGFSSCAGCTGTDCHQ